MAEAPFQQQLSPEEIQLLMQLAQQPNYGAQSLEMPPEGLTGLPDAGLGPVTPDSIAGRPNASAAPFEPTGGQNASLALRQGLGEAGMPGLGERLGPQAEGVLDYGSMPAQAYADQFGKATDAVAGAMDDPSVANIANAGAQSGMALGSPLMIAGSAALGFGDAARRQFGPFVGDAEAAGKKGKTQYQGLPGLTDEQNAPYLALQERADREGWGPKRRAQEFGVYQDMAAKAAERQGASKQGEYDRRVRDAEQARAREEGRDRRFSETPIGQFYNQLGGGAPLAAAIAGAGLGRWAHGPMKGLMGKLGLPWLEGTAGAYAMQNLPDIANASTETQNPAMRAAEEYGARLPDGHPDKQRAIAEGERLRRTQPGNPVREGAVSSLANWDTQKSRGIAAAAEGTAGPLAAGLMGVGTRLTRDVVGSGDKSAIRHLLDGRQAAKAAQAHRGVSPGAQTPEQRAAAAQAGRDRKAAFATEVEQMRADPAFHQWVADNPNATVRKFNGDHGTSYSQSQFERVKRAIEGHVREAAEGQLFPKIMQGRTSVPSRKELAAIIQSEPALGHLTPSQLQARLRKMLQP